MRAATAVELVHMATLVHDDVLDAAPLRRGRPTVVARAGRARPRPRSATCCFSRAFAELAAASSGAGRRVRLLAGASVGLARGELAQRRDAFDVEIAAERYLERCRLKTARLFECACLIGADAEPGDAESAALHAFGREIGLAFQLLDDVLDVAGPPERTGKARGTDLLDGTVTLPLILARERDPGARRARPARARRRRRRARLRPDRRHRRARGGPRRRPRRGSRRRRRRWRAAAARRPQRRELLDAGRRRRRRALRVRSPASGADA